MGFSLDFLLAALGTATAHHRPRVEPKGHTHFFLWAPSLYVPSRSTFVQAPFSPMVLAAILQYFFTVSMPGYWVLTQYSMLLPTYLYIPAHPHPHPSYRIVRT